MIFHVPALCPTHPTLLHPLLQGQHENVVHVREIVVGSNMDKIYIVMDYVEHDLKSLMENMTEPFLTGEVLPIPPSFPYLPATSLSVFICDSRITWLTPIISGEDDHETAVERFGVPTRQLDNSPGHQNIKSPL